MPRSMKGTCCALFGAGLLLSSSALAGEITVWCWDPNFNGAIMQEAGARYTAQHPGTTIKVVDFAKGDVEQKLQTGLASGTTQALPDIVLIEDYGAQKYLQSFPGAFAALTKKVDYSAFAPYKVKLMTVGDEVYGMPFDTGVAGMFYRKDYLEAAGFKPADMENITWDRYVEIGKAVSEKTGKKMVAIDPNGADLIRIMMQSQGKWYVDDQDNLTITDNAALKASLEVESKLINAGAVKTLSGWTEWAGSIGAGDVATVMSGVWITGTIKAQADQAGKWGLAPIPSFTTDGKGHASNLGGSSWYVLDSSAEKDEAIDFLSEVFTKDIGFYQKILTERGAVGSLLAARTGDAYGSADAFFGGEKVWQRFATWLAEVPPVNYGAFTTEIDAAVMGHLPEVLKGEPIDDVLKSIEAQAQGQIQ